MTLYYTMGIIPDQIPDVVEIFQTALTGAYNWDYTVQDNLMLENFTS